MSEPFDVAIVGASVAGCIAAIGFGRAGLRVSLLERRSDPAAFKPICTHNIQACASGVLREYGLEPALDAAGAVRTHTEMWTPHGWIRDPSPGEHGWNVTRQTLDPLLRAAATASPGVTTRLGATVTGLIREGGRAVGVSEDGEELRAGLVVAADGRASPVAEMAGLPLTSLPHGRFVYWAYFEDMPKDTTSRLWLLNPKCAYIFPNEAGKTLVACFVPKAERDLWKADTEAQFRATIASLPDAPPLGRQVSRFFGFFDMPNTRRPVTAPGLALIGDAALAPDPLFGLGCGWAVQSAAWLVHATAGALSRGWGLPLALQRYRWQHATGLSGNFAITSSYSTGRRISRQEHALYEAAVRDPAIARTILHVGTRIGGPSSMLTPRVLWAMARRRG